MRSGTILAAALATMSVALLPTLPPLACVIAPLPVLAALRWRFPRPLLSVVLALALGLAWGVGYGHWRTATLLPASAEGLDWQVRGRITGLPEHALLRGQSVWRFELAVQRIDGWPGPHPPRRLRLAWYGGEPLQTGEVWQFTLRLKRPRGTRNPGLFDYGSWLVAEGFDATGYVRRADSNHRLQAATRWPVDALREHLSQRLARQLGERPGVAALQALLVGDRRGMARTQWDLLARTGTIHLLVISGLHIGLLAGAVLWLGQRGAGAGLPRRARWLVPLLALAAAWAYAGLAGFGVPVRRAALMFSVLVAALAWRRQSGVWRPLCWALLLVVIADPLAVIGRGSWLSFLAVALILWVVSGRSAQRGMFVRVQLALMLGLMPWLAWFGAAQGLVALPANLLAVPLVSLLVVPSLALGLAVPGLWELAALAMEGLQAYLVWLDGLGLPARTAPAPGLLAMALAVAASFWWLAPRGVAGRWVALPAVALLLLPAGAQRVAPGLSLTQLDVGQGTAVLVTVGGHALLYDAGPASAGGFDAGAAIVVPYLQRQGVHRLDVLVLSHADQDHAGGADAVLAALAPRRRVLGEPVGELQGQPCLAGTGWRWGEAYFEWLYPATAGLAGNAASCVLAIRYAGRRLLLTGDIGRAEETALLQSDWGNIRADVIAVPHHGSRYSSSLPLVARTGAQLALVSAGYRNAFGHPHPDIVARWERYGARVLNSAEQGGIHIQISPDGLLSWHAARERRRYWD
ncbi:MAG TPA: DNA internalization-related competence protein ComEC/Rec2 [Spongiibacteraceae bacterium]|nr:DNA internalization-related competence protein ComEC/Rec2 [Spongiibacteraceae bacterium]HUH37592.1 DNA internalization-related competence protein ComEC/Rec2 [Spongiibacteraceae bacterium]